MGAWVGQIYSSGTLTANGNSGFIDLLSVINTALGTSSRHYGAFGSSGLAICQATLRMIPADLATDETLALDLNIGWDSAGTGDVKVHDFTGVTATNVAETLILPGGESEANLQVESATPAGAFGALIPPYWKFVWVLGGTSKSMSFTVDAAIRW